MIVASACLAGMNVRYDGRNCFQEAIAKMAENNEVITVCPEVLGGLPVPREPAEIVGGDGIDVLEGKAKVVTKSGKDVTKEFIEGAYETLNIVKKYGAKTVVLKENSPSCGSTYIYNGEFNGTKKSGMGVAAALLIKNGITVMNEQLFIKKYWK